MELLDEYNNLIFQYRRKMRELQKAERKHEDFSIILFIDKERNAIHNQLRELAPKLGKTASDITIDILESDKDLSEYQMPEFKLVRTKNAFKTIHWILASEHGKKIAWNRELQDRIKNTTIFIPFGQQEYYHLFDATGYPMRQPEEFECRRRLDRLASLIPFESYAVDIYSAETFHRGTLLYGLAFSPENIDKALSIMGEHKSEISIDKRHFDPVQIEQDVVAMAEDDISYVLQQGPGEYETIPWLLKRLRDSWRSELKLPAHTEKIIAEIFDSAIHKEELEYERQEVEEAVENDLAMYDRLTREHTKESGMPKKESFKRKLF